MKSCYTCRSAWDLKTQPGFRATCDSCGMYWHCCMNCRFYDSAQPNGCRNPGVELVADKEKANFCEEFMLADRGGDGATVKSDSRGSKRSFDALFGDA